MRRVRARRKHKKCVMITATKHHSCQASQASPAPRAEPLPDQSVAAREGPERAGRGLGLSDPRFIFRDHWKAEGSKPRRRRYHVLHALVSGYRWILIATARLRLQELQGGDGTK